MSRFFVVINIVVNGGSYEKPTIVALNLDPLLFTISHPFDFAHSRFRAKFPFPSSRRSLPITSCCTYRLPTPDRLSSLFFFSKLEFYDAHRKIPNANRYASSFYRYRISRIPILSDTSLSAFRTNFSVIETKLKQVYSRILARSRSRSKVCAKQRWMDPMRPAWDINGIQVFGGQNRLPPEISERLDDYWNSYKIRYNKSYSGNVETSRRTAWEENLITIYKHNMMAAAGHHSYTLRDNHIADLGTRQYIREMVKLIPSRKRRISKETMVGAALHDPGRVPVRFDWREAGFKTRPQNQKDCGSCYAYSIAGSIQGQIFKETGMLVPLSEQQLVDCSTSTGNLGCSGGSLRNTLRYLERAKGLMRESHYPYKGKQGPCRFKEDLSVVNITSWAVLPARDERALEAAVATIGPIAASINASPKTFQLYHKGIYDDDVCSSDTVNHAMLIVGYTPTEWILKNWWGDEWGENGYMRLAKNKNRCGIANYAAYAKV